MSARTLREDAIGKSFGPWTAGATAEKIAAAGDVPLLYAAVLAEGCVRCHVPHGGTDRHLLRSQQVAQLCYECHTVTPADHIQPSFRQCTNCHVGIHGSNVDPLFLQQ